MISKLLHILFPKTMLSVFNDGVNEGVANTVSKISSERELATKQSQVFEIEDLMDKPVIVISNEWEDMGLGIVCGIEYITKAQNPVPVVHFFDTDEKLICLSKIVPFSYDLFVILEQLTPYQRWAILTGQWHYMDKSAPENAKELKSFGYYKKIIYEAKVIS